MVDCMLATFIKLPLWLCNVLQRVWICTKLYDLRTVFSYIFNIYFCVLQVAKKGCWGEDRRCVGKTGCFEDRFSPQRYFCCCEGHRCNANFSYIPARASSGKIRDIQVPYMSNSNSTFSENLFLTFSILWPIDFSNDPSFVLQIYNFTTYLH
jgi:hypothetical protein